MPHLKLRIPEDESPDRDVLPFPAGWADAAKSARDARRIAADLLEAERGAHELDAAVEQLRAELEELQGEIDGALHLSDYQDWRPPAA